MLKWWQETVFYEIYMPSFKDGNGDGIGDFKGLREKMPYLAELGIGGIWLTPFYPSPKVDNGYDVSDYCAVDPDYGTMADLEAFVAEAHAYGIRVIADMVVNHVSTEHAWFMESRSSKANAKRDWFVWQDAPNNWESFFGGSAWEWDAGTQQYYYHSFAKEQVDLNWRNEEVRSEIWKVFDFWLAKGLDGFRLDVINNLTLTRNFPDNPVDASGEQVHVFDKDQPGMHEMMAEIGARIRARGDYFTVGEISSDKLEEIEKYAGMDGLDVTFNFNFGSVPSRDEIVAELARMQQVYADGRMPTLFFGSHDMSRSWNRLADGREDVAQLLAMLMLTAHGVPFIYFGEELGMADFVPESLDEMRDVQGVYAYEQALMAGKSEVEALMLAQDKTRDKARAPMTWPEGFSDGAASWISQVTPDFERARRMYRFYQALIALRKTADFCEPGYRYFEADGEFLMYIRGDYLVCLNFGEARTISNAWGNVTEVLANMALVFDSETIALPANAAVIFKI
ncbi:glucohydrolase [Listeria grandensis]|uniref:Glucohydrolase n=1 Tax=Listeria grandensis TaxID=1494963 RepID=A0A7X0Y1M4_9LIST|nr:alpha-amylase family glycosyl hydrolase [Listeria grandensis]MBC1473319.1 glucohydrolase [Listeria grandensis]MBC1935345.1 glucohydrolase [Listeria grandensis]